MTESLAELMRQAGIAPPAWQGAADIPRPRPRPMPRQMRPARQRAADPRLSIESRLRARAEASPATDIDFATAIREGMQSAPIARDEYVNQLRDMSRGGPVPDQVRNFPGDITGVNSMVAGARAFGQGDVQGGIINSGLGAITGLTFGAGTGRLRPSPIFPSQLPRGARAANDRSFGAMLRAGGDEFSDAAPVHRVPPSSLRNERQANWNLPEEELRRLDEMSPLERARFLREHQGEEALTGYERLLLNQSGGLDNPPPARTRANVIWGVDPRAER